MLPASSRDARGRLIGGLSASRYFLTVFLWIPVSLVIALMDSPLRFAACTAFHLAVCFGVGFRGAGVAFLRTLDTRLSRSFSSALSLSSEASTCSQRLPQTVTLQRCVGRVAIHIA